MAVDIHARSLVGKILEVAVRIADADGSHLRAPLRHIAVVVGNAMVARQRAYQGNAAVQGHRGPQLLVVRGRHGGIPVQDSAQPHHVGAGNLVIEHGRAAAQVPELVLVPLGKFVHGLRKAADLPVREGNIVGSRGQVGKHALQIQMAELLELFRQAVQFTGKKAAAAHPGIHAQMDMDGLVVKGAQGIEMFRLLHAGKGGAPAVLHNLLPFSGKTGTENERACLHPSIPHPASLRHRGDAEKSAVFTIQSLHYPFQSVPVGLRLHNGHQAVVRHHAADDVQIVPQRIGINLGPCSGRACATHARSVGRRVMLYKPELSHLPTFRNGIRTKPHISQEE